MTPSPDEHHPDREAHVPPGRPAGPPGPNGGIRISKVLLVGGSRRDLETVDAVLRGNAAICAHALDIHDARTRAEHDDFDVIILDADRWPQAAEDFARWAADSECASRTIFCSAAPTLDLAIRAMRCGSIDLLALPLTPADLMPRLIEAQLQAERARDRWRKVERLKRICRRLSNSRQQAAQQVDELCEDLASAYKELADQMGQVTLSTEFTSLIRQELDVESLLRTTLEFLLTRTGPTNAAVFLPNGQDDYALGAYVNFDLPKDTAEVLLDHLADTLPQRFAEERGVVRLDSPGRLAEAIGTAAVWLAASHMLACACHDEDGRCLAVIAIFRDGAQPFPAALLAKLELIRDLFAEQLGRIVKLHNRHRSSSDWNGFDVANGPGDSTDSEGEEDWGMAA